MSIFERLAETDLARSVRAEQANIAAGAAVCGQVCDDGCHGPIACIRAVHSHHPNADNGEHPATGRRRPKGDVTPHAAFDADGVLVQWTCLPGDHDGLNADQRQATRAAADVEARGAATRALMDQIDPALLVSLLREGGHL